MGVVYHHVKTRGAGGPDDAWNLMPLTIHRHTEVHQIGLIRFAEKYSSVRQWLIDHGWEIDPVLLRWTHIQAARRVGANGGGDEK